MEGGWWCVSNAPWNTKVVPKRELWSLILQASSETFSCFSLSWTSVFPLLIPLKFARRKSQYLFAYSSPDFSLCFFGTSYTVFYTPVFQNRSCCTNSLVFLLMFCRSEECQLKRLPLKGTAFLFKGLFWATISAELFEESLTGFLWLPQALKWYSSQSQPFTDGST